MKQTDSRTRAAYVECFHLAKRHYENFPVASRLIPAEKRNALAAIYAFARYADDVADEPDVEGRLELLADWRSNLRACYDGKADLPVFISLRDSIQTFPLSFEHFDALIRAFESDVRVNRHPDFASLLAYCRCSANPVGRLVLELFGHRDPDLFALSDHICTALQLTNFWQDIRIDVGRDRLYLPLEDLHRFRVKVEEIKVWALEPRKMAGRDLRGRWRALMAFEVERTRDLFEQGKPLPERVVPSLRRQLRLTWRGGTEILTRIEAGDYDVFERRPALTLFDFFRLYWKSRRPFSLGAKARAAVVASPR